MDYTQGAMRNASKGNYYPCNSEPMSQGIAQWRAGESLVMLLERVDGALYQAKEEGRNGYRFAP